MEAVVAEAAMMEEARAMDSGAGKSRADCGRTDEAGATNAPAGKMPAAAHRGERRATTTHTAAETTAMHSAHSAATHAAAHGASKATAMAATEATAVTTAATAMSTTASGEGYRCKRNAGSERRRREKREQPVLHQILPDWDRGEPLIAASRGCSEDASRCPTSTDKCARF
jgi:hypothetical protein